MGRHEHTFSWRALSRIGVALGTLYLVWQLSGIFADILIALMLSSAIYPIVAKIHRKFSLTTSTLMVLFSLVVPIILACIYYVPTILAQLPDIVVAVDAILMRLPFVPQILLSFDPYVFIGNNISRLSTSAITLLAHFAIVVTLIFYFILDHKRLLSLFLELFPKKERLTLTQMLVELKEVNGKYIAGNVLISLILTVSITAVMLALGIPYALPLGIFAGVMDLLPIVGSIIGAIPAILIAFSLSPIKGVILLVVHLLYQQLENSVISPMVYKKTLSISSVLGFLSVIIGASLFGVVGAFIALPVAASIPVILKYKEIFGEGGGDV